MDLFLRIIQATIIYGAFLGAIYFIWLIKESKKKLNIITSTKYCILEILVPKNNDRGPLATENLFASLHGIFNSAVQAQDSLSFEIVAKNQEIKFYIYTPSHLKDFIEGQVYAQYPLVEISEVDDYTKDAPGGELAGTDLLLNKSDVFPIKTFDSFEVDPLAGITGVLSKTEIGEQIWIQVIISPVPDTWQKKGVDYVNAIRQGIPLTPPSFGKSILKGIALVASDVVKTVANRQAAEETKPEKEVVLSGPEEAGLKGIEEKVAKLGFNTKIRIISFAKDEISAKSKETGLVGAFKQFNTTNLNGFGCLSIISDSSILEQYQNRVFGDSSYILNIQELASVYHLPSEAVFTPSIVWAGSKKGEPPSNLPIEDSVSSENLTMFAQTNYRHMQQKFGIKLKDRRLHLYAIGKTGTGKSTMLENMIIDDIREGRGVAVVDPHGDLIEHILNFIPDHRVDDIVYFSPADRNYPIGFNVMENVDPDLKSIVASGVVGIFKKIFGESWGPRLEYILRNAIIALLDYPDATMLGITQILVDKDFRNKVVANIDDPVIKHFWINEFEKYDQKFRTEAVAPIQNKVGQFLSSSTIRNIVGQPKSTIDLADIMDNKKILLLDLSIGKIGEDTAALLGAMMITKIQLAAMHRASIPEEERIDFYLYVDEFQNFATDSFAVILSEARKYHLNLIMTNQYIAQMPEIVQKAVFGNIGTIVSFRVGAQDASALVKEFEPVFDANDLVNLDNYNIYVKMAIDGVTCPAFSSITLPPYSDKNNNRDIIIEKSRQKYSQDRGEVEKVINESMDSISIQTKPKDEGIRYPRQIDNNFIEIKDKKTGELYYAKNDSESAEDESSNNKEHSDKKQNSDKVGERSSKKLLTNALENNSQNNDNDIFNPDRAQKLTEEQIKKNKTLIVEESNLPTIGNAQTDIEKELVKDNIQIIDEDTTIKL